ncbi:cyclase family protein [Ferruginivarius sediminum]|jgi:kynurenine formamidase|nr:cyclase family protein [Ferruginivarius sediminum]
MNRLSRRNFFRGAGAAALAGAAGAMAPAGPVRAEPASFTKVVDMTHTLHPDFPTYFGKPGLGLDTMARLGDDGFNMNRWSLVEHTGTHMDAPIHFSEDGRTADEVPIEHLVVPLVVVDIREKADSNPDAQVTPDDLKAWVADHGPIPDGACVAMNSGWGRFADSEKFRNADDEGTMHFPGFHIEATQYLLEETSALGMAVDTLSLDFGRSKDFATHYAWLPTNRWGIECLANLDQLPAKGATLIAGGPKIAGATGGPGRMMALMS